MAAREDVMLATAGHSQRALTGRCLLTIGRLQMHIVIHVLCARKPDREGQV